LPAGAIVEFLLVPQVDGFPLLAMVLSPFLIAALYASTTPRWGGVGVGFLLFFGFGAVPNNPTVFNPIGYFNNLTAIIIGVAISAAAFGVILPPTSRWWLKHIVRDLRQQVVATCLGRRSEIAHSFESASRDLMYQAGALIDDQPDAQQVALAWMFVTLEIGHAMIELRRETAALVEQSDFARRRDWARPLWAARDDIVRLFDRPSETNRRYALATIKLAIDYVQRQCAETAPAPQALGVAQATRSAAASAERVEPSLDGTATPWQPPHRHRSSLLRIASYLHFMRSALLDPLSPLPGGQHFRESTEGERDAA
jgi:uncharacterized membrane protein YccC